ncbi:MAG: hypothetical protein NC177_03080 [Ruminococcus flavefaciens]|nr:hypothetical protein [Ruminococcus flavefaciens]
MLGEKGLRNIILATALRTICGIAIAVPDAIIGIRILKGMDFRKSKFQFCGTVLLSLITPVILFTCLTSPHLKEQKYIKNTSFADFGISCQCISDLITDDYETFTVNNCYIDSQRYSTPSGRGGGSGYHYEYRAVFYNGESKVMEMQIGADETDYLKNLPYGFDTEITVYKKSGFLRSIEPSVDFDKETRYEHFFTISISGDKIIYEKNVDTDIKNLTWSGFKKNHSYDINNALFGINAGGERQSLDSDYIGTLCSEVCLYGTVDGKYRRLSNILNENDSNKSSGT